MLLVAPLLCFFPEPSRPVERQEASTLPYCLPLVVPQFLIDQRLLVHQYAGRHLRRGARLCVVARRRCFQRCQVTRF
jgi:hypothetical protein